MLSVDSLCVDYGPIRAVDSLTIVVAEGSAIALLGPNGAGKSSTLLAISGALRPAAGAISFDGESVAGTAPEKLAGRGMALVPEGRHVFARLTVIENLKLAGGRSGCDLDQALDLFPELRPLLPRGAGLLSGGEQQMLVIARALLTRPRLLLLDEPSLGLAPAVVDRVYEALATLRAAGMTMVVVEQNASHVLELCDDCYVMGTGRLLEHTTSTELAGEDRLADLYLGGAETR